MLTNLHVLTHKPKKTLIILAISSRIYVEAAVKAGFAVIAIDAFADKDTKRLAIQNHQVDFDAGQLNTQQILNILATLDLAKVTGVCFGAGFEAQTDFLVELEKKVPVFGNCASTVKRIKAPETFFLVCKSFMIPTPETRLSLPENPAGWLQKTVGGSGGAHISAASASTNNNNSYYQQWQAGVSFSCLFLANVDFVQIVGFNEQWTNSAEDFCYGGSVSHAEIDADIKEYATCYIQKLCKQFELKGLNSCDFIYNEHELYLLEINPRLSASLDLYESQQAVLMQAHLDIFEMDLREAVLLPLSPSKAHQIVYAQKDTVINRTLWPTWISDIPDINTKITTGEPICTINAVADDAKAAKQLLEERFMALNF